MRRQPSVSVNWVPRETVSVTFREEHWLTVFEREQGAEGGTWGKREEVTGDWRGLHNEERHDLCPSLRHEVKEHGVGGVCGCVGEN